MGDEMHEFTDFNKLDLEDMATEVITAFGERYLAEAMRVVSTGILLPEDAHMVQMSLHALVGLYLKQVRTGETIENKVIH